MNALIETLHEAVIGEKRDGGTYSRWSCHLRLKNCAGLYSPRK